MDENNNEKGDAMHDYTRIITYLSYLRFNAEPLPVSQVLACYEAIVQLSEATGSLSGSNDFMPVDYFALSANANSGTRTEEFIEKVGEAIYLYRCLRDAKRRDDGYIKAAQKVVKAMKEKDFSQDGWIAWDKETNPKPTF